MAQRTEYTTYPNNFVPAVRGQDQIVGIPSDGLSTVDPYTREQIVSHENPIDLAKAFHLRTAPISILFGVATLVAASVFAPGWSLIALLLVFFLGSLASYLYMFYLDHIVGYRALKRAFLNTHLDEIRKNGDLNRAIVLDKLRRDNERNL